MSEGESTAAPTTPGKGTDKKEDKKKGKKKRRFRPLKWLKKIGLPFDVGVLITALVWTTAVVITVNGYTGGDAAKVAVAMLAAFAASAIGGLIGFLFGVPRGPSNWTDHQRDVDDDETFRPNTNLEQVSDWLTKIIVGVGLIQFRQIGDVIGDVGRVVGAAIGDIEDMPGTGTVFAIGLMVSTSVVTFLLAYMWTTTALFNVYRTHVAGRGQRKSKKTKRTDAPPPRRGLIARLRRTAND